MFVNRDDAGHRLAARLEHLRGADVVVLGLPRGGVPVAFEVARALEAPLDVIVVRKLGAPFQPELAMGAVGEGGVRVVNEDLVAVIRIAPEELAAVEEHERAELERRALRFRRHRERVDLAGRTAVVVDDGIATGATARAACQVARAQGAQRVVLAVPVGPPDTIEHIRSVADEVVCVETPGAFHAIGQWYADFAQVRDEEVVALLDLAAARHLRPSAAQEAASGNTDPPGRDEEVQVRAGPVSLGGHLAVPDQAPGVVVFAHGSGSSRHSPRNRYVAGMLNRAGVGTLLLDLLTPREELDRSNVFDIGLLAGRLADTTEWLHGEAPEVRIGYFGASTGAAAALVAAAEPGTDIAAVVSRGGRPDLAGARLEEVRAPTLLIVGGHDEAVLDLNRRAQARLHCENRLRVVPGATHLFEEPGALETVADLARDWFVDHLTSIGQPAR
ncbi:phosphoribosyltransferase [Allosalinactinospora lopnorensis]|uniref:phosphoribosyltransferase n=1 Tax=Allosalinactinospora lopnorensis TaxID=1352348 RepID=UPI000623FD78|nr:phosphoribosyltransferase [Allosalinactinospora lopnorensis]